MPELPPKRGRPRVPEAKPGASVATWLEPAEHDKLIQAAKSRETSISALLRALIKSFQK
jgi:hypothetical protein